MDFSLSDEQTAIFDMARAFGEEHIAPYALQWEKDENIPKELWPKLAELGFGALYVSEDKGGSGLWLGCALGSGSTQKCQHHKRTRPGENHGPDG